MKIAPTPIIREPELLPELRGLFNEHSFLRYRSPETVRHALRALRGIEADVFAVETVLEVLRAENGEVLS